MNSLHCSPPLHLFYVFFTKRKRKQNNWTFLRKWNILRCYLCGQSGAHVKCLGRGYIPGIGYVCVDCNRVAKYTENSSINNVYQPNMKKRLEEHKRRLLELTSRDDPVLLASSVFGRKIWCKRFGIKNCQVNVVNLGIGSRRKIKISKIVDLVHTSNSRLERILHKKIDSKSLPSKTFLIFLILSQNFWC